MTSHATRPQGSEGTLTGSAITVLAGLLVMIWAGGFFGLDHARALQDWLAARSQAGTLSADFDPVMLLFDGMACAVLFLLGVALVHWGGSMAQRQWVEARNRKAFAQEPWKWRLGWTDKPLLPRSRSGIAASLLVIAVTALLVIPASIALVLDGSLSEPHVAASLALCWLYLAVLVGFGIRWLRAVRWRRSLSLQTDPAPLRPGAEVRFELRAGHADGSALTTRLVCEQVHTSIGEKRKITREVLWETFHEHAAVRSGLPLIWSLRIPEVLPDSTPAPAYESFEWRLEVLPSRQGPIATFDLPAFGGRPAAEPARADKSPYQIKLSAREVADSLRRQGVETEWQGDSLRAIRSLPGRHRGARRVVGALSTILTLLAIAVLLLGVWPIGLGIGIFAAGFWWLFSKMVKLGARSVRFSAAGIAFETASKTWKRRDLLYAEIHPSMRIDNRYHYALHAVSDQGVHEIVVSDVHGVNLCTSLREYLMAWADPNLA